MLTDKQIEVAAMIVFRAEFSRRNLPESQFRAAWMAAREDEIQRVNLTFAAIRHAVEMRYDEVRDE